MIELPDNPQMADFQRFIHDLEAHHGWLDVDLVHNLFLMTEEVGELAKAIRKHNKLWNESGTTTGDEDTKAHVGDEIVDVLNYLLAIANRLDIDVEAAFRRKNAINLKRTWDG